MKDQLTAVLEAVRLVQGDLAAYLRAGENNPRETLDRIIERLASPAFVEASRLLDPGVESPSIVPELAKQRELKFSH